MALKPIREMQYAENIGNPVFITDLAVLSQNIVELKAAINMFGKTTAIIYGFDKTEGGYTPGIVLHNKQLYSYAAGDVIPANTYLHSVVQQTTPRILENGSTFNAYVEYTFIANSTSTGDDLITSEPLTDDYVAELKNAAQGIPPITTDMIADGAVTAAKLAEQPIVNRGAASDLNNATTYGFYTYDATTQNTPTSYGSIIVVEGTGGSGNWIQLALGYSAGNVNPSVFVRFRQSLESWSDWVKIWKSNDFNPDNYLPLSGGKMITGDFQFKDGVAVRDYDSKNIIGLLNIAGDGVCVGVGNSIRKTRIVTPDDTPVYRNDSKGTYEIYDSSNFNPDSKFNNLGQTYDSNNVVGNGYTLKELGATFSGPFLKWGIPDHMFEFFSANRINEIQIRHMSQGVWGDPVIMYHSGNFNPDNYLPLSGGKTITGDVGLAGGKRLIEDGRNIIGRFAFGDSESLRTIIGANIYEVLLISTAAIKRNTGGIEYTLWDSGNFNPSDYLSKENTTVYVPTGEYNPATKGYVDSAVENGSMKEVTTTNLNAILTEGTCFFTFPQSSTNAPTVEPGGGLQIDLTDKFVQFVTTFPSSSKAGPSFYRTSNTGSASTFSPWVCLAENGDFGRNVYFEQQLDATHFNDAPVIKKLIKRSYTNKYGPATVVLDNYASTQFPGVSSQYAPIAFRGYAKFTNYSTKATLAIVPVNSQSNNNYTFFTYVNPSSIYQVMANFTGGLATVREQVDYWVEITYGKVV
jgi:hypothetical protein